MPLARRHVHTLLLYTGQRHTAGLVISGGYCRITILFPFSVLREVRRWGTKLMDFPWKEQATLVRMAGVEQVDDQSCEILFEGSLLAMATRVRDMKPAQRKRLRLSIPDRQVRPHTFQGDALTALIDRIPQAA
jgi:hypothetical protein